MAGDGKGVAYCRWAWTSPRRAACWWRPPSASGSPRCTSCAGCVGRGSRPSRCFLMTSNEAGASNGRLAVLESSHNGFSIAEADLVHRCGREANGFVRFSVCLRDHFFWAAPCHAELR